MKLYFRGEEKGNLSYTTDGVRFTSTTLDALRNGVALPNDTDYTKVQVRAGSNVFSALDVVKKVELVQGSGNELSEEDAIAIKQATGITLIGEEKTSGNSSNGYVYYVAYEGDSSKYYQFDTSSIKAYFKNKNTSEWRYVLDSAQDNEADWEYVIGLKGESDKYIEIVNLGSIDPFMY